MLETLLHDNHFSKTGQKPHLILFFLNLSLLLICSYDSHFKIIKRYYHCKIKLSQVLKAVFKKVYTDNMPEEKDRKVCSKI